jgi:dienelactone hydrolase
MTTVRAVHTACTVPGLEAPLNTAHLKVFYPADPVGDMNERMTGVVRADASGAPYPVVVFFNGINVAADSYRWLATELAERGYVTVLFTLVEEVFGTGVAVSPGIDVDKVRPETFGTAPCGTAVQPVLDALAALQGPLDGLLDLDRVALGGHSGGGTVVLQSATPAWFPGVRAVFTYGAHAMASTVLGWPVGQVLDLDDDVAVLLMTGEHDGVMAASAVRYGEEAQTDRVDPVERTYDRSFTGGRGDVHHLVFRGANHFTVAHPLDPTSARAFLDEPATGDEDLARAAIVDALTLFLDGALRGDDAGHKTLQTWTDAPPAAVLTARSK